MDKFDTSVIHCPSELYAEIVEILTACGLVCEYTSAINSQWGWHSNTALCLQQVDDYVEVNLDDWVIDKLLDEVGRPYACKTITFKKHGAFGLLCSQIVSGLPKDNPAAVHAEMSIPHGNC